MPRSYTVTDPTGELTVDFNLTEGGLLVPDGNGVFWSVEELEGWDGPDVRQVLVDPYGRDGMIVGVNELSDRIITLSNGFCESPSEDARWNAELEFGQLLAATVAQGTCHVVVHEDIDRFMDGYLASKPEWKESEPGSSANLPGSWPFQFEASLVCPIPYKQSHNAVSDAGFFLTRDATVAVPTLGNYPLWPVVTFDFPVNGDSVTDQFGNSIVVTSAHRGNSSSAPPMPFALTIDMGRRTCTDQAGLPAWDCIQNISPFQLLPNGGSMLTYHLGGSSSSGTQHAAVGWFDAWL